MGVQTFQNGSSMIEDEVNTHGRAGPSPLPAVARTRPARTERRKSHGELGAPGIPGRPVHGPLGTELDDSPGLETEKTVLLLTQHGQESRYVANTSPAKDARDSASTGRE